MSDSNKLISNVINDILKNSNTTLEEWIKLEKLPEVMLKDRREDAKKNVLRSLILCYAGSEVTGINKTADNISKLLFKEDLERFSEELFDKYIEDDSIENKKWIADFCGRYGGEIIVSKMENKINEWIFKGRIPMVLDLIIALSLNGSERAFAVIENMERTCRSKKVRTVSAEAIKFAADEFKIDKDVFLDNIVPYLGLNERGMHVFKYSESIYYLYITKLFNFIIYDDKKRIYKTLPWKKNDLDNKGEKCRKYFKDFKIQFEKVTYREIERLESEISYNRKWTVDLWFDIFLKNPLMRSIAENFVWGIFYDSKIVCSLKFKIDNVENEGYVQILGYKVNSVIKIKKIDNIFDENDNIDIVKICASLKYVRNFHNKSNGESSKYEVNLIHPVEIGKNQIELWKDEFEKNNILQPIDQLYRLSFVMSEDEAEKNYIDRFTGKIINSNYLGRKMNKYGWYKGSFKQDGCYYGFYKENISLKIVAELRMSGIPLEDNSREVTVYLLRFYRISNDKFEKIQIDKVCREELLRIYEVPRRFFSEVLYDVNNSLLESINTDYSCIDDINLYS